jgi:ATP-dependent DNA ligase
MRGRGFRANDHIEDDGPTVFRHACKLGLEGIASNDERLPVPQRRSPDWLKMKNPACAAVKREEEEDWGRRPMATSLRPRRAIGERCAPASLLGSISLWRVIQQAPIWQPNPSRPGGPS